MKLYESENLSYENKFYLLMDLLVTNQSASRTESILFFSIFYIQFIFGFFDNKIKIFNSNESNVDQFFNYIERIIRLLHLLDENHSKEALHLGMVIFFILCLILVTIIYLVALYQMTKQSFYSVREIILNYAIKIFFYAAYPIILDYSFSYFSFSEKKTYHIILCLILLAYSTFIKFFIQNYYNDTIFLSSSYYAKVSSNYDFYLTIHTILYSFIKLQAHNLTIEFFCLYNIGISVFFSIYYSIHYIYYEKGSNLLCGFYHLWYIYTSIFCFLFYFISIKSKGLVYIISSLFIIGIYLNFRDYREKNVLFQTPFYKISNKYHVLYYLKTITEKINTIEQNENDKAIITGIIQMHMVECPNENCILKNNCKLYLPISQEWSFRDKPFIYVKVFLINFVIAIMNFYISQNFFCADMLINISFLKPDLL